MSEPISPPKKDKLIFRPEEAKAALDGWLVHSHKGRDRHDRAARRMDSYRYVLGVPVVVLSAVVGTSVITDLQETVEWGIYLVGLLAIASASLAGIQTSFNYSERAEKHRIAGVKYKAIIREIEETSSKILEHLNKADRETPIGKFKIDDKEIDIHSYLSKLRIRLDRLEDEAPVVPQEIYDQIEDEYKNKVRHVKTVWELYQSNAASGKTPSEFERVDKGHD
jgi:hypothetical protein